MKEKNIAVSLAMSGLRLGHGTSTYVNQYSYQPEKEEEQKLGNIMMTIEIEKNPVGSKSIADTIWSTFKEMYYANPDRSAYDNFESTLKEINETLRDLAEKKKSKWIGHINCVLAVYQGEAIHLSQSGAAEGYLLRSGKLNTVIEESTASSEPGETFLSIASGNIQNKDLVILSSSRLLRTISGSELQKNFAIGQLEKNVDRLRETVTLDKDEKIALGFLYLAPVQEEILQEVSFKGFLNKMGKTAKKQLGVLKEQGKKEKVEQIKKTLDDFRKDFGSTVQKGYKKTKSMDRKNLKFTISVLTVVLVVIIAILVSKGLEGRRFNAFQNNLNLLRDQIARAERVSLIDKIAARDLLYQSREDVNALLKTGFQRNVVMTLAEGIAKSIDSVDNIKRISQPEQVVDLAKAREGVDAMGLIRLTPNSLNAYDYNAWYTVVLDQPSIKTITQDGRIVAASKFTDEGKVVFRTNDNQLLELKDDQVEAVPTNDERWHDATAIEDFNNYLYFLDPLQNQIWKYRRGYNRYGESVSYNEDADLKDSRDLTIDGFVWILNKDGSIIKMARAKKEAFEVKGLPESFNNPTKIVTQVDSNSLYILDPPAKRIVAISKKDGHYVGQYTVEVQETIKDILPSDDERQMYILTNSKIYRIDL